MSVHPAGSSGERDTAPRRPAGPRRSSPVAARGEPLPGLVKVATTWPGRFGPEALARIEAALERIEPDRAAAAIEAVAEVNPSPTADAIVWALELAGSLHSTRPDPSPRHRAAFSRRATDERRANAEWSRARSALDAVPQPRRAALVEEAIERVAARLPAFAAQVRARGEADPLVLAEAAELARSEPTEAADGGTIEDGEGVEVYETGEL